MIEGRELVQNLDRCGSADLAEDMLAAMARSESPVASRLRALILRDIAPDAAQSPSRSVHFADAPKLGRTEAGAEDAVEASSDEDEGREERESSSDTTAFLRRAQAPGPGAGDEGRGRELQVILKAMTALDAAEGLADFLLCAGAWAKTLLQCEAASVVLVTLGPLTPAASATRRGAASRGLRLGRHHRQVGQPTVA